MKTPSSLGRQARACVSGALLAALSLPSPAGGPIGLCDTDTPLRWPAGGVGIPFNPDQGDLGALDHATAVALVQDAFDVWGDVPSSTATYVNAGVLPVDVDINNFAPYLSPAAPDGLSAIVFDDTGEIFDLLFGPGSGILGFAGPEWVDPSVCTILEGVSFLNGPAFTDPTYAFDVMVHEFGHYSGLGHTVVNGQIYIGDTTGPSPDNATFGSPPDPFAEDVVETMYPFYFGSGVGSGTPEKDDVAALSTLYPEPDFATTTGNIAGFIYASDGVTPLSGVNVIARNLANPFHDAVSAISGDYSVFNGDAATGRFTLRGLTPGASYAIYIDQILAGGFSAPVITLPGVEEFYNGADESNNLVTTDTPTDFTAVSAAAGATTAGINVILNGRRPGDPLPILDEGFVELALPFPFTIVGQTYNSVFVNDNGSLTFGSPAPFPDFFPGAGGFLDGPPRIAALWHDLNAGAGGTITFEQTGSSFTVHWKNVPSFPDSGDNTFSITLRRKGNLVEVKYGGVTAVDGVAGLSGGFAQTSGLEVPQDLLPAVQRRTRLGLWSQPAILEVFDGGNPFDLAGRSLLMQHAIDYNDRWAGSNDTLATAKAITVPFNSSSIRNYTEISPVGADADYFKFEARAGDIIKAELTRGGFDTTAGIFAPDGTLVAVDDDSGSGLLSLVTHQATQDGTYTLAISAFPDFEFDGDGGSGGRYVLELSKKSCPGDVPPSPANWLVNGSFEAGDFTGWSAFDTGAPFQPWYVADDASFGFFGPVVPADGCFAASNGFDGEGPMESYLLQELAIPAGEPSATLEWQDRLVYDLFNYGATVDREYYVVIYDPPTGSIVEVLYGYIAEAGTVVDTGWISHSANLDAYIGQTIGVAFLQIIPEAFSGPGQYELDGVRLRTQ